MAERIADALIIVLDEGQSLAHRDTLGDLERDGALWDALRRRYGRLVLITHGGPDDLEASERLGADISVVCNANRLATHMYISAAADEALRLLQGCQSVVVRTEEMMAGASAIEVVEGLRRAGLRVGFVGRGGYLWSRFIAVETGPGSQAARAAAYRERALCQAADVVIGATEPMVADLAWRYALARDVTAVVPNWVIEHDMARTVEQRDKATILCVGSLRPRKRAHLVVEAACALKQNGVADCVVRLVGDGPDRPALEAMARRDGVELHIESGIRYRDLLQRMSECAIFAAPSSMESHPRTLLEAMSTAAPVIVADAPGLDAMVEHGVTGLRMAPESGAFARAIEGLLGDSGWRDALGSAAMASVRTQFSPKRVADLELAMHERAIAIAGTAPETYMGAVSFDEELLGAHPDHARAAWRRSLLSFAGRFDGGPVLLRQLAAELSSSGQQADAA